MHPGQLYYRHRVRHVAVQEQLALLRRLRVAGAVAGEMRPGRLGQLISYPRGNRGRDRTARAGQGALMLDMRGDREAPRLRTLRLDHRHDQALCGPEGEGDRRSPT
jgi:hypothetical protein